MTAEIAILNRHGVALAADSAVTVTHLGGGQKIYNSVNKLFMLSRRAPVGVMVFGVAELTGVPWETIIKSFRRELGDQRFPNLRDYANALVEYIKQHPTMFDMHQQEAQLLASVLLQYRGILRDIDRQFEQFIEEHGSMPEPQIKAITDRVIREHETIWANSDPLAGRPSTHAASVRRTWKEQIDVAIEAAFGKLPLGNAAKTRLRRIAGLVYSVDRFPDNVSGVVVAGFGDEEYFPCLVSLDMEGVLLNFLKYREQDRLSHVVGPKSEAAVIPFAQREMVTLFMEGLDPRFRDHLLQGLMKFSAGLSDLLAEELKVTGRAEKALRRNIETRTTDLIKTLVQSLSEHSFRNHVEPVVSAVAALPKEELAEMAEALVNLTSVKRRVTRDPETVGGPVDVAVISKGDGFIWIKRKHYFDPALNQHFFANYYRG